ncbi:NAD dependent epimerase/dehydratase family protein [Apiospora aurea]|uniref:NAD dependent epimerase/dehydratase family protein n=1 Tax=Apiospora aurea TaxID=335848 RepID=A0ABR1PSC0_9PEZI
MPTIFIMGGTGHIGGAMLDLLAGSSHPVDVSVLVLARDQEKAANVTAKYPQVHPVVGDFANLNLIETTYRGVDIVINAGLDITHDEMLKAVLRGLQSREGNGGSAMKPYFIHTSSAYLDCDLREPGGTKSEKVWDDIEDSEQLVSMPGTAVHRVTDKLSVRQPYPITMPALFQCLRAFHSAFVIGEGENAVGMIHVRDFARMNMVLVDNALATLTGSNNKTEPPFPVWGENAYYFASAHGAIGGSGHEIKSVSTAEVARQVLSGGDNYDPDTAPPPLDSWATHIAQGQGANLRIWASKMRRLGWVLEHVSFFETMDDVIPAYLR